MSSSKREGSSADAALDGAVRYARSGVRSTREVLTYLRRRGISEERARRTVADYHARGLLDDQACARLWAEHWARRGYAWSAIRVKLSAKGFDGQALERAARRVGGVSDDEARARLVVAAYLRRHRSQAGRAARALASRGFDQDLIERILNESFSPIPSDAERGTP